MNCKMFMAMLCCCAAASAQTVRLGVDDVLGRVAGHNADVRAARQSLVAAQKGVDVAKSARLPEIDAELSISYIGDGTILDRDFSNAMRDRLPHFGNALSVSLYQPLYTGGAVTEGIRLASTGASIAALGVEQQTQAVQIEALDAYFDLLKMYNLGRVYDSNISLTRELLQRMEARHREGTALRNDITRYELRLSSLSFDRQSIANSISILTCNLNSLLGYPAGTYLEPDSTAIDIAPPVLSEAEWLQLALQSSTDLRAISLESSRETSLMGIDRAQMLPSAGIFAGDNLSGPVTFEIPAIDKNYNSWWIGVSVRYNISSLFKTPRKLSQHRARLVDLDYRHDAIADALSRRIHTAYTLLQQASQQLDTEKVNVRLANENYRVVKTRFENDMALLTDMLDASVALLDSEVRLVNARISMLLCHYQLKYISSTL